MTVFFNNRKVRIILAATACLIFIFMIATAINAYAPSAMWNALEDIQ